MVNPIRPLNVIPIENFINKSKIAYKSKQKSVTLTIDEAVQLTESITIAMIRLAGVQEEQLQQNPTEEVITVNMDGGGLR
jgi:hypothetical protein